MTSRLSPRTFAASMLFGLTATRLATPVAAQRAPSPPSAKPSSTEAAPGAVKRDSGPAYAYPATGTSAAARALAGQPAPVCPAPGPVPLPGRVMTPRDLPGLTPKPLYIQNQ